MTIKSMLDWIESTDLSIAIREGGLPYPIIGGIHLLAIALFGGMVLASDLRLLGWLMPGRRFSDMWYQFRPWKRLGFVVVAATGLLPAIKVVGVETETSNDWVLSLEAGHPVRIPPPQTIADGMRTQQPGSLTFPIVQRLAHRVVVVSDAEVKEAMRFLLLRLKLLVEPTGAVPAALLFSGRLDLRGQRVGVILSGGNADPALLAELLGSRADAGTPDAVGRGGGPLSA